ncbi:hypothetical protein ACWGB8_01290 [Kitasatospora sp. NPDC054939]
MIPRPTRLAGRLLLPVLFPVQFATMLFHTRADRLKDARSRGDRGAISIELALAIIALVVVAGAVAGALYVLRDNVVEKVKKDPIAPAGS